MVARNAVFDIKLMWTCVLDPLPHRGLSEPQAPFLCIGINSYGHT